MSKRLNMLILMAIFLSITDWEIYKYPREIPMLNPMNLGAKCDGMHDDTEAFKKAAKAAIIAEESVMVPDGCWVSAIPFMSGKKISYIGNGHATLTISSESAIYLVQREKAKNN